MRLSGRLKKIKIDIIRIRNNHASRFLVLSNSKEAYRSRAIMTNTDTISFLSFYHRLGESEIT